MLNSWLRLLILGAALVAAAAAQDDHDVLFQVSTIDAVLQSIYDGVLPYGELEKHGDFGIGIFEGIDGEMVALDGAFYQVKADGRAYPVGENMTAPFATVTFFETDWTAPLIVDR
jgi:acetolactate decarboxylase